MLSGDLPYGSDEYRIASGKGLRKPQQKGAKSSNKLGIARPSVGTSCTKENHQTSRRRRRVTVLVASPAH